MPEDFEFGVNDLVEVFLSVADLNFTGAVSSQHAGLEGGDGADLSVASVAWLRLELVAS